MSSTSNSKPYLSNEANLEIEREEGLLCPSAQPDWADAKAFGVVGGTVKEPRVSYFAVAQPVTKELLNQTHPVSPTEVLRIAAPCARNRCQHFEKEHCQLVSRTVVYLKPVIEKLPPCQIRMSCRWWNEHGKDACFRCPQVVAKAASINKVYNLRGWIT